VLNFLSTMPWRRMGKWRYSSTYLDLGTRLRWEVSFTPGERAPRYPLDRRLGGPQCRSGHWRREKSCTAGNRTRAVEPVASRYTDWALPAPHSHKWIMKKRREGAVALRDASDPNAQRSVLQANPDGTEARHVARIYNTLSTPCEYCKGVSSARNIFIDCLRGPYTINHVAQHCVLCNMIDRVWCWLTWSWMGKLVLRETILRNMIDRVWAALEQNTSWLLLRRREKVWSGLYWLRILHSQMFNIYKNKKFWEELIAYFPWYDTGHIENDASNNTSVVACVFVTTITFLPSSCLAMMGIHIQTHRLMGGIF
jgi:hypothetical protein